MKLKELFVSKKDNDKRKKRLMAMAGGGAGGGGGAGAGGGAGSGAGAGTGGGAGPGNGSGAGAFGDSSGGGGSAGGDSITAPTNSAPGGYSFLGSMPAGTKKKKKKKTFKYGTGIYENSEQLEALESKLSVALQQAREATKLIKYDNTVNEILVKISSIAEEVGIDEKELDYYERQIFNKENELESQIYEIEEVFTDKLRAVQNAIEDLEQEEQDQ